MVQVTGVCVDHWGKYFFMEDGSPSPFQEFELHILFLLRNAAVGMKWVASRSLKARTLELLLHLFADLGCFFACELTSRAEHLPYWELLCFLLSTSPYFPYFPNVCRALSWVQPSGRHSWLSTYQGLFIWVCSKCSACIPSFSGDISLVYRYFPAFTPRCLFPFASSLVFLPHQALV